MHPVEHDLRKSVLKSGLRLRANLSDQGGMTSNRHPAPSFCLSAISAQTFRVCRGQHRRPRCASPASCLGREELIIDQDPAFVVDDQKLQSSYQDCVPVGGQHFPMERNDIVQTAGAGRCAKPVAVVPDIPFV